ncbi:MAG: amidohydrolase family protein, partial [Acidimicrobiia bacterium]
EVQQVLAGNAAAVYDFDLDALAPLAATAGPTVAEVAVPLDEIPADATSPGFYRP